VAHLSEANSRQVACKLIYARQVDQRDSVEKATVVSIGLADRCLRQKPIRDNNSAAWF
jgi:hypothetical protein